MKKLLNLLLFGNTYFKEFPAISTDENTIGENVVFDIDGKPLDVSKNHWLLSLEPMVFGIWLENEVGIIKGTNGNLNFKSIQNKTLATLELHCIESKPEKEGTLFLFEVKKNDVFHCHPFKLKLIYSLHYKRPNVSFGQFKNLLAAFSFPRKVRLISFKKEDYFNMFPMDLVGEIPNTNRFVFGLRHSNNTLIKIIEEKKIVVIEFPAAYKNEVYQLGKHHSGKIPNLDALPFDVKESNRFQFPVPQWAMQYHEIEITQTLNLGSHMLLYGEVVNTVTVNENRDNLYHIHFLLHQHKTGYTVI